MGPEDTERSDESRAAQEGIIQTATGLFASLGYDGTTLQMIADAAGFDIAYVTALVGNKRDLYLTVMERTFLDARVLFDSALAEFTPDRAGIHRLVNRYLDFCLDHPEKPALWIHRWLGDAADIVGLENIYVKPLLDDVTEALKAVVPSNLDIGLAWTTIAWCVYGFVVVGLPETWGHPKRPDNPAALKKFRTYLLKTADNIFLHLAS